MNKYAISIKPGVRDHEHGAGTVDKIGSQYRAFGTMTEYSPVDKIRSNLRE